MQLLNVLVLAAAVSASPILEERGGYPGKGGGKPPGGGGGGGGGPYGSCPKGSQYNCQTSGFLNILTCSNILSGNIISIPFGIFKREELKAEAAAELQARGSYPKPPKGGSGNTGPTCCQTSGFINILTCTNIASGNIFGLPIIG